MHLLGLLKLVQAPQGAGQVALRCERVPVRRTQGFVPGCEDVPLKPFRLLEAAQLPRRGCKVLHRAKGVRVLRTKFLKPRRQHLPEDDCGLFEVTPVEKPASFFTLAGFFLPSFASSVL